MNLAKSMRVVALWTGFVLACFSPKAESASRVWTGNSNGLWNLPANWVSNVAPANGDTVVFPTGPTQILTTNPPGAPSTLLKLTLTGPAYEIDAPALSLSGGILVTLTNSSHTLNTPVSLTANQTWSVTNDATLEISSPVSLNGNSLSAVLPGNLILDRGISGSGAVAKSGGGQLDLRGASVVAGSFAISGGTVVVDGSLVSDSVQINGGGGGGGATLAGNGSVRGIVCDHGTIAPGRIGAPGILTSGSNVTMTSATIFPIDLNGTLVGIDYDCLQVFGSVDVGQAQLELSLGFLAEVGDSFTIIENRSSSPTKGTFAGLPEGALIKISGRLLQISYAGVDGNNVVLRDVTGQPENVRIWTGAIDGSWDTGQNWSGNIAPTNGDILIFPAGASHFESMNPAGAPATFGAITFTGGDYVLHAPTLTLTNGLANLAPNFNIILDSAVVLTKDQTWILTNNSSLLISSNLTLNSTTLRLQSDGSLMLQRGFAGFGTVTKSGSGQVLLMGSSSGFGVFNLQSGTMTVDGLLGNFSAKVSGDALLEGSGYVPSLNCVSGTVAPGRLAVPGILTCNGPVTFTNGVTLAIDVNGPSVGFEYDCLLAFDAVNLGGAKLSVSFGFISESNQLFTIVKNQGPSPVHGTFAGLPEGSYLTNGTRLLQLSYAGDDGNDVVLHDIGSVSEALPPTVFAPAREPGGQFRLQGRGFPGAVYVLDFTPQLDTDPIPWLPAQTNVAGGDGLIAFPDIDPGVASRRFYRIRRQ